MQLFFVHLAYPCMFESELFLRSADHTL